MSAVVSLVTFFNVASAEHCSFSLFAEHSKTLLAPSFFFFKFFFKIMTFDADLVFAYFTGISGYPLIWSLHILEF